MISVHWVKADIAVAGLEIRFLNRSAHERTPGVGGGQISGAMKVRTGGPHSHPKIPAKKENPLRGRMLQYRVNLAVYFTISPMAGLKNCYARLQESKIIAMRN